VTIAARLAQSVLRSAASFGFGAGLTSTATGAHASGGPASSPHQRPADPARPLAAYDHRPHQDRLEPGADGWPAALQ
jgi:hypothetical protein